MPRPAAAACFSETLQASCTDLSRQSSLLHAERKYTDAAPLLIELGRLANWQNCPAEKKLKTQEDFDTWQDNHCEDYARLAYYYEQQAFDFAEEDAIWFALTYRRADLLTKSLGRATGVPAGLTGDQLDFVEKAVLRNRSTAGQTAYARMILISALPAKDRDPRYAKALKTAAKRSPVAAYMIWTDDSGAFSSSSKQFYLMRAVEAKNPEAMFVAATQFLDNDQAEQGNALMLQAAEAGHDRAAAYVQQHGIKKEPKRKRPQRDAAAQAEWDSLMEATESGCNAFWRRDRSVDARSYCACVRSYAERRLSYEDPRNVMLFNLFVSSSPLEAKLLQVQLGYRVIGPKSGFSQNTTLRMQLAHNGAMSRCGPSMRRRK